MSFMSFFTGLSRTANIKIKPFPESTVELIKS